jgi:class 3 adenylate cyclase
MGSCKEIVDGGGGSINKFLGDGFLAYWIDDGDGGKRVSAVLRALRELQQSRSGPGFRVVMHYGSVAFGGGGSLGEDSLSGLDVTTTFRMEKLAGSLGCDALVSEAVEERLRGTLPLRDLGAHHIAGLGSDGQHYFAVD